MAKRTLEEVAARVAAVLIAAQERVDREDRAEREAARDALKDAS